MSNHGMTRNDTGPFDLVRDPDLRSDYAPSSDVPSPNSQPPETHLAAALGYAQRGWRVFPLQAGTKGSDRDGRSTHLLSDGYLGASDDPTLIRQWWTRWPEANIGLSLAASGLVALDPDLYKPDCAWEHFVRDRVLPDTLIQRSARGGRHYLLAADPEARFAGKLCDGVEIKHRGYILLEPSTFEGRTYRFETRCDPAPVPDWVPRAGAPQAIDVPGPPIASAPVMRGREDRPDEASWAEVEELLGRIDPDAGGYEAWLEVLQALHDHSGGSGTGLAVAESWSRRGAKFRPGEVARKWAGFEPGRGVTLKTLAWRAGAAGANLGAIARRHRGGTAAHSIAASSVVAEPGDPPDLSHDQLALDLGLRSWDEDARFVALWGRWLFWQGTHWRRDETLEHLTRTRDFLRTRAAELVDWAEGKARRLAARQESGDADKLRRWAREQGGAIRSNAAVTAVSNLARTNPASATTHEAFDADLFLLGTPGGTVDLRSGVLRPGRRSDMISRRTSCAPAPPGTRPELWLRVLGEVFAGDEDTVAFLQRVAGYALTGSVDEHKLLFLHGAGRNGKSLILNTLLDTWGEYGRRVAATTFLNSATERHPTDIAGLHGARLAIASELPRGKTWDEATIKDLTGGDRLTARLMRQDFFDFDPQLTLMIAGNTQPSFKGVDEAIRSRVVLVPFTVTIPEDRRDIALPSKLKAEAPAILRWCIDGALAWQARGLNVPRAIANASSSYFDEEDTLGQFLEEKTAPDPQAIVSTSELFLQFNHWSELQGLGGWAKTTLVKEMRQRGFKDAKTNGNRGLRGFRLK